MIKCNSVKFKKHDEFVKAVTNRQMLPSIGIHRENISHQNFSTITATLAFLNSELSYNETNPNVNSIFGEYFYTPEAIAQINSIIGTLNQFNNI